jgi:hypothetical protein
MTTSSTPAVQKMRLGSLEIMMVDNQQNSTDPEVDVDNTVK